MLENVSKPPGSVTPDRATDWGLPHAVAVWRRAGCRSAQRGRGAVTESRECGAAWHNWRTEARPRSFFHRRFCTTSSLSQCTALWRAGGGAQNVSDTIVWPTGRAADVNRQNGQQSHGVPHHVTGGRCLFSVPVPSASVVWWVCITRNADASVIGARRKCRHPDTGLACQRDLAGVLAVARPVVVCRRFSAADVPAQHAAVGMVSHNWCWLPLLLPVPSHGPINVMSPPLLVPSPRGAQRASPRAMRHGLAARARVTC